MAVFLALNAGFAALYLLTGGIKHARPGSFADAFYFSVQTMGTIAVKSELGRGSEFVVCIPLVQPRARG